MEIENISVYNFQKKLLKNLRHIKQDIKIFVRKERIRRAGEKIKNIPPSDGSLSEKRNQVGNQSEKIIYNIGAGTLYICLFKKIGTLVAEKILEEHKILESPRVSVIFKDTGFINDIEKTNVIQTLKVAGITDVKSV